MLLSILLSISISILLPILLSISISKLLSILLSISISKLLSILFFFNWHSLHARLNSHYEAWSYKKKKAQKGLQATENLFTENLQLKDVC